jgi:hypothetical protein
MAAAYPTIGCCAAYVLGRMSICPELSDGNLSSYPSWKEARTPTKVIYAVAPGLYFAMKHEKSKRKGAIDI